MPVKNSQVGGLSLEEGFLTALLGSLVGTLGATVAGRIIVSSLLKLIPGAGSLIGGTISAATASTITITLGKAYLATLEMLFTKGEGELPSPEEIEKALKHQLQKNPPSLKE